MCIKDGKQCCVSDTGEQLTPRHASSDDALHRERAAAGTHTISGSRQTGCMILKGAAVRFEL